MILQPHVHGADLPRYLGVKMWLDPSDSANYTVTSGAYEKIVNKGAWGGYVSQSTASLRPPQAANYFGTGLHAVYPDDVDDIMDVTGTWDLWGATNHAHTVIFVWRHHLDGHGGFLDMSNGDYLMLNTEAFRYWDGTASTGRTLTDTSTFADNTKYILEISTPDPSSSWTITLNGSDAEQTGGAGLTSNDIGSITKAYSSAAWPAGWRFADFLAWDRELSAGELTAMRTFLNNKWSIY